MNKCNRRSWVESWHCLKSPDCTIGMTDGQPGGILRPVAALLAKLTRPLQASGCVFLSLEKARSRHSGRAASDLLIPAQAAFWPEFSDFRYSSTADGNRRGRTWAIALDGSYEVCQL